MAYFYLFAAIAFEKMIAYIGSKTSAGFSKLLPTALMADLFCRGPILPLADFANHPAGHRIRHLVRYRAYFLTALSE